jgi:hypothetical protein
LSFQPKVVWAGNKKLARQADPGKEGWTWTSLEKGGVLRIKYSGSDNVIVSVKTYVYEQLNPPKVLF